MLTARDLPPCDLSDHLERRLEQRLQEERMQRAAMEGRHPSEIRTAEGLTGAGWGGGGRAGGGQERALLVMRGALHGGEPSKGSAAPAAPAPAAAAAAAGQQAVHARMCRCRCSARPPSKPPAARAVAHPGVAATCTWRPSYLGLPPPTCTHRFLFSCCACAAVRVVNNVVKRNDVRSRLLATVQGEGYPEAFIYRQKVRGRGRLRVLLQPPWRSCTSACAPCSPARLPPTATCTATCYL